jgi:hypothetical protein
MTVHQPGSWIVLPERNCNVPSGWERDSVTASWVLDIQTGIRTVEGLYILGEHPEIMAVNVNWVRLPKEERLEQCISTSQDSNVAYGRPLLSSRTKISHSVSVPDV